MLLQLLTLLVRILSLCADRDSEARALGSLGLQLNAMLDFREFLSLVKRVERTPLVSALYNKHANKGGGGIDRAGFADLWREEQGETPPDDVLKLFDQLKGSGGTLSEGAFYHLITSSVNEVADPALVDRVYMDMTHPLPHYFIQASHKSYLASLPTSSLEFPSSYEMLTRSLLLGCRLLELDVWDSDTSEPHVHHQHAIASKLYFSEALNAILEHAFTASPYPLIITLNLHCSASHQLVVASLLRSTLGGRLHTPPAPKHDSNADGEAAAAAAAKAVVPEPMPSPESLKYKILLRGVAGFDAALSESDGTSFSHGPTFSHALPEHLQPSLVASSSTVDEADAGDEAAAYAREASNVRRGSTRLVDGDGKRLIESELMRLLFMVGSVESTDPQAVGPEFAESTTQGAGGGEVAMRGASGAWLVPALNESASQARLGSSDRLEPHKWVMENMSRLSHVAPRGERLEEEAALEPIDYWNVGVQAVPLSFAACDPNLQTGLGKFLLNGRCGYVLKPRRLRNGPEASRHPYDGVPRKLTKLQIKIVCAMHLPKPGQRRVEREAWQTDACPLVCEHELSASAVVNPCVVVEAMGGIFAAAANDLDEAYPGDVWTSRTVQKNGLSPAWMQTVEVGVSDPELAVIRCSVWDRPGNGAPERFLCYVTLPACALRTGYRVVQMRDTDGCKVAFCKMLWHVRTSHTHLPSSLTSSGGLLVDA